MAPPEFKRLVENVKTDGKLTSAVLACQNEDGSLELLSGHHRTAAAIAAEFATIEAIVITTPLNEERKVALQLSHNAVAGQDNPSLLAELYASLSLDAKIFSGLTDEVLDLDKLNLGSLAATTVQYEELRFAFLPEDRERFEEALKTIKESKTIKATHAVRLADFDQVFEAIIAVKDKRAVVNSALAVLVMAELALERLAENEASSNP